MKILILYSRYRISERETFKAHLNSFKKKKELDVHYLNIAFSKLPSFIFKYKFDLLILHYSFLAGERFYLDDKKWISKTKEIEKIQAKIKIAIPQDEYLYTSRLTKLFNNLKIDIICTTLIRDKDIDLLYSQELNNDPKIIKVLTGYLDLSSLDYINKKITKLHQRKIDIGYRARELSFSICGEHGQLKIKVKNQFKKFLKNSKLKFDIENTNSTFKTNNSLKNKKWFDFLMNCKYFLGCEGGSSLYDKNGQIYRDVENYLKRSPNADFFEIKNLFFKQIDFNIKNFALGPRNLECILTKTVQVLVEGEYNGVLKPWKHYLPIKKDFSNIEEIFEKMKDYNFTQNLAENAYKDIIKNKELYYENFISNIVNTSKNLGHIFNEIQTNNLSHFKKIKMQIFSWGSILILEFYMQIKHFFLLFGLNIKNFKR